MRIYFAAPLDSAYCRESNERMARDLVAMGHEVYLPQAHGVGDEILKGLKIGSPEYEEKRKEVWKRLYELDMVGLKCCDCVIAISTKEDRHLSAGMIWEMGWASGNGKLVLLCTQNVERTMDYNLMIMCSVDKWFGTWSELIEWVRRAS